MAYICFYFLILSNFLVLSLSIIFSLDNLTWYNRIGLFFCDRQSSKNFFKIRSLIACFRIFYGTCTSFDGMKRGEKNYSKKGRVGFTMM